MKETKDYSLLLVDDDKAFRDLLRYDLESEGYTSIAEAEDGDDALDTIIKKHIDLVLLDLRMPRLNGEVVLQTVKENHPTIAVIVVTGVTNMDVKKAVLGMGADAYIEKPYDTNELLDLMRSVLSKKHQEPSRGSTYPPSTNTSS